MKILIINSFPDSVTDDRIKAMSVSQRLKTFSLFHTYANLTTTQYKEEVDILVSRFKLDIEKYNPELIILHTGAAFYDMPENLIDSLSIIKQAFPHINIAYQNNPLPEYNLENYSFFNKTEKYRKIVDKIFNF